MTNPYIGAGAAAGANASLDRFTPEGKANSALARQKASAAKLLTYQNEQALAQKQSPAGEAYDAKAFKLMQAAQSQLMQNAAQNIAVTAIGNFKNTHNPEYLNRMKADLTSLNGGIGYEGIQRFEPLTEADREVISSSGYDPDKALYAPNAAFDMVRVVRTGGEVAAMPTATMFGMHGYQSQLRTQKVAEAAANQEAITNLGAQGERDAAAVAKEAAEYGTPEYNTAYVEERKRQAAEAAAAKVQADSAKFAQELVKQRVVNAGKTPPPDRSREARVERVRVNLNKLSLEKFGVPIEEADFNDPAVKKALSSKVIVYIAEGSQKLGDAELKVSRRIQNIVSLTDIAKGLNKQSTGMIDSMFVTASHYITESTTDQTKAVAAFGAMRTALAHALFGASQTSSEMKSFRDVMGDTNLKLGTLLNHMIVQLGNTRDEIAGMKQGGDGIRNNFYFGNIEARISKTIEGLQARIDTVNYMEANTHATNAEVLQHFKDKKDAEAMQAKGDTGTSQPSVPPIPPEMKAKLDAIFRDRKIP